MISFALTDSYQNLKFYEQSKGQRVKNTDFTVSNYYFYIVEIDKKMITSSRV